MVAHCMCGGCHKIVSSMSLGVASHPWTTPPPLSKGPGTRDTPIKEHGIRNTNPTLMDRMTDRHLWKRYLPSTWLSGGDNALLVWPFKLCCQRRQYNGEIQRFHNLRLESEQARYLPWAWPTPPRATTKRNRTGRGILTDTTNTLKRSLIYMSRQPDREALPWSPSGQHHNTTHTYMRVFPISN